MRTMIWKNIFARTWMGILCLLILGWAQGVAAAKDIPPKVKLKSPDNHAVFAAPATITLEATASDKDGTIKRVQFFNGSHRLATIKSAPYTFTWTNVKAGKYTLTAVATDNRGVKTTSHEVHIIVDITPTVSLTSPAEGATFKAPASITLTADAKDPDGRIAKVDFFQGTSLLATLTAKPYTFTWNNVAAGNYSLTARATDNRGLTTSSSAVNITVNSGEAQLFFIYTDQLNTPRVITDQTNKVVWRWDNNDPFGANVPDEDPDGDGINFTCNLRFPGQYADRETGMNYNYFRDYDPNIGRYIQSDPIGLAWSLDTYAYVGGNPMTYGDPKGLFAMYGNWGGRYWSGGQAGPNIPRLETLPNSPGSPVDLLDSCFRDHDYCYSSIENSALCSADRVSGLKKCDKDLVRCIDRVPKDASLWCAYNPLYCNAFRRGARFWFSL